MTKDENIAGLKAALQAVLQPIFEDHLSLPTWAKVWVREEYGLKAGADKEISDLLAKAGLDFKSVWTWHGGSGWQAEMTVQCELELNKLRFNLDIVALDGQIVSIDLDLKAAPESFFAVDLARALERKMTFEALK